jgi:hypothetical protein
VALIGRREGEMKKLMLVGLMVALGAGCNMPGGGSLFSPSPQAWIDAPLEGAVLPMAPYQVVFHGADPDGVQMGEFMVNGVVHSNLTNPDAASHLITFRLDWNPPGPGQYTLRARTLNSGGEWSNYSEVHVSVQEPALTATGTPAPAVATPPSVTPTAIWEFTDQTGPAEVHHGNCQPNQITYQVSVGAGAEVAGIVVFSRLQGDGGSTNWDGGRPMVALGGGLYQLRVDADSLSGSGSFSEATLLYQYAASDAAGQVLKRSEVYADVHLSSCELIPPPFILRTSIPNIPPIIINRPTATPQVVK